LWRETKNKRNARPLPTKPENASGHGGRFSARREKKGRKLGRGKSKKLRKGIGLSGPGKKGGGNGQIGLGVSGEKGKKNILCDESGLGGDQGGRREGEWAGEEGNSSEDSVFALKKRAPYNKPTDHLEGKKESATLCPGL